MPSQANIQTVILNGQYKLAQLVNANLTLINSGHLAVREAFLNFINLTIKGLVYQYDAENYTSTTTITLYDRISGFIGIPSGATIDPNFQAPNTTIIIDGSGGTIVNSNKYPFVNTTSIGLYTYNILYKHLYGNNPTVAFYLNNNTQDEATPNNIEYATPGDITSDIISITWDYPLPVSGYISITGAVDGNGNTPSGGVTELPFDQDNLISDAGNYYLELPVGIPISVISNNVSIPGFSYDKNYSPPRLYGFAGNYEQEIIVTVV